MDDLENRVGNIGSSVDLDVSDRYLGNNYQWYRNGIAIENNSSSFEYGINSFSILDEGDYHVEVWNSMAPDLILVRNTITLMLYNRNFILDSLSLVNLYNLSRGPFWSEASTWLSNSVLSSWEGVESRQWNRVVELYLADKNIIWEMNNIEFLAGDSALSKLRIIDMRNNRISTSVSVEVMSLGSLRRLLLGNNMLEGIDASIVAGYELEELEMLVVI